MRRALVIALAAAAALAPSQARAAGGLGLAETAGARFPDRAYAVALPRPRPLTAADIEVRENGAVVPDVSVTPADGADARRFGVVLAIDTSYSMRGRPLRAAIAAAREFVRHRSPDQPVSVITFGGAIEVLLPFSTDRAEIDRALSSVHQGGGGSRLLDAAARAVELIRAGAMVSGSAVILSDGADRGSTLTLDQVAAAAGDGSVRLYGVGLASRNDDFGVLNLLAAETQAEFSAVASLSDLARVYGRLGSRLAHQYLVQYHSAVDPGRRVAVQVRVDGVPGVATTTYRSPALRRAVQPPFEHAPAERLWLSPAAVVAVAVIVAMLVFAALWLVLRPRESSVRRRMASWVESPEESGDRRRSDGALAGRLLGGAERSLDGREWWDRFRESLDIARISTPPVRLLAWVALGTIAALMLFPLVGGSPAFAVLAFAIPVAARQVIQRRVARQRSLFTDQMPDNMQVVASAMRAGHSFAGALAVVVEDAPEPTRRELQRVIADERLGAPLDTALASAVRRMDSKDLEQVALVAALQRETGGNTAEVIDRVTASVRERLALRRLVGSLTAQGRMSRWVLTGIPVFLLVFMTVVNPAYMSPLFTTGIGKVLLVVCAVMVSAGSLVIKRIVDIKV